MGKSKNIIICALLFALAAVIPIHYFWQNSAEATEEEMRGVWIASVYNINFPSQKNLPAAQMAKELDSILNCAEKMNLNAIFFQVRPVADALYPSEIYPWSAYLTGKQGQPPQNNFDPLAYLVAEGQKRGIGIHAWINPYKVTRGTAAKPNLDIAALSEDNPARIYADLVVANKDTGELYLDPGEPMARYLVLQGVQELIDNYELAGIHYDDYFYPGGSFDDAATYALYGEGYANIADWRRHNVDLLIQETYQLVKNSGKDMVFGVSPAGVWANKTNQPTGSETQKCTQTYYDHYADTKKWVEEGWLDYIAPQLYWNIGNSNTDYQLLVDWWSEVVKKTDVKLYIGHAAYRVGDPSQGEAWMNEDEIKNQVLYNRKKGNVEGSIFYGYSTLEENKLGIQETLADLFE